MLSGCLDHNSGSLWNCLWRSSNLVVLEEEGTVSGQQELALLLQNMCHCGSVYHYGTSSMSSDCGTSRDLVWRFPILDFHNLDGFFGSHWLCSVS